MPQENAQSSRPKLLIVDDDTSIRTSLARIMRHHGFEVQLAEDGERAVELCRDWRPDLLVLDIRLPGIDGVATFAEIRKRHPAVPAVFMSAYAASDLAASARELGAVSVCAKPLDVAGLVALVDDCRETAPVLIVDDDPDLLASLARALRAAKLRVETADSVAQATRSVRQRPDRVVVADVFLEDGFGYELLREMAAHENQYSMVLLTGKMDWLAQPLPQSVASARLTCIGKPADIDNLLGRVHRLQQREKFQ